MIHLTLNSLLGQKQNINQNTILGGSMAICQENLPKKNLKDGKMDLFWFENQWDSLATTVYL